MGFRQSDSGTLRSRLEGSRIRQNLLESSRIFSNLLESSRTSAKRGRFKRLQHSGWIFLSLFLAFINIFLSFSFIFFHFLSFSFIFFHFLSIFFGFFFLSFFLHGQGKRSNKNHSTQNSNQFSNPQ